MFYYDHAVMTYLLESSSSILLHAGGCIVYGVLNRHLCENCKSHAMVMHAFMIGAQLYMHVAIKIEAIMYRPHASLLGYSVSVYRYTPMNVKVNS